MRTKHPYAVPNMNNGLTGIILIQRVRTQFYTNFCISSSIKRRVECHYFGFASTNRSYRLATYILAIHLQDRGSSILYLCTMITNFGLKANCSRRHEGTRGIPGSSLQIGSRNPRQQSGQQKWWPRHPRSRDWHEHLVKYSPSPRLGHR